MANVKRAAGLVFSLDNDPTEPTEILWRYATVAELAKYQAQKAAAQAGAGPVATQSQLEAVAAIQYGFVKSLITGARHWSDDGVAVETADDVRARMDDALAPGQVFLFVQDVIVAHYPGDMASFKAATKGAFPN